MNQPPGPYGNGPSGSGNGTYGQQHPYGQQNRYGQQNPYGAAPADQQYGVSWGEPPQFADSTAQYGAQRPSGGGNQPEFPGFAAGEPTPPKSKLPMILAAGLAVALAAGAVLFFVLPGSSSTTAGGTTSQTASTTKPGLSVDEPTDAEPSIGGGGGGSDSSGDADPTTTAPTGPEQDTSDMSPDEVTLSYFTALDDADAAGVAKYSRGDAAADNETLLDQMSSGPPPYQFADAQVIDEVSSDAPDAALVVLYWEVNDVPSEVTLDPTLAITLADTGKGYKICSIDERSQDIDAEMSSFESTYESDCGI